VNIKNLQTILNLKLNT